MKKMLFLVTMLSLFSLASHAQSNMIEQQPDLIALSNESGLLSPETTIKSAPLADSNWYQQGVLDAQRMYPKKNTGAGGTFFTCLLLDPVIGLVPALLCSAHPPKTENLGVQSASLMNNEEYMKGYTEEAHKMKKKVVWINYGVGSASYFAILGLYFGTLNN
jgi:hypothetical protein